MKKYTGGKGRQFFCPGIRNWASKFQKFKAKVYVYGCWLRVKFRFMCFDLLLREKEFRKVLVVVV